MGAREAAQPPTKPRTPLHNRPPTYNDPASKPTVMRWRNRVWSSVCPPSSWIKIARFPGERASEEGLERSVKVFISRNEFQREGRPKDKTSLRQGKPTGRCRERQAMKEETGLDLAQP